MLNNWPRSTTVILLSKLKRSVKRRALDARTHSPDKRSRHPERPRNNRDALSRRAEQILLRETEISVADVRSGHGRVARRLRVAQDLEAARVALDVGGRHEKHHDEVVGLGRFGLGIRVGAAAHHARQVGALEVPAGRVGGPELRLVSPSLQMHPVL